MEWLAEYRTRYVGNLKLTMPCLPVTELRNLVLEYAVMIPWNILLTELTKHEDGCRISHLLDQVAPWDLHRIKGKINRNVMLERSKMGYYKPIS